MDVLYPRTSSLLDKKYREFFIPTILMAMTTTMSIVVDSIIVGNMLGEDALAAVNLVAPVIMVYNSVAVLLGFGAATVISVSFGKRQTVYANEIFTASVMGMLVVSTLLTAGQAWDLDAMTSLLTREPTLAPLVRDYLNVLVYGSPFIIVPLGLVYCLRADGSVKLASAMLIVSNLVNLALDLVYMGPLEMGIAGSSLATVSGYIVGAMLLFVYASSKERNLRFSKAVLFRCKNIVSLLRTIAVTGSPAAMSSILFTIKILAINTMVQHVAGKTGMVAFAVCLSCLSFVSMFISGAAQAMTPIVGFLYGEGDYAGVRFVIKRAAQVLFISGVGVVALLEGFPGTVLHLFGVREAAVIAAGIPAVRIFALSLAGTCYTFLAMYYYMTIGRRDLSTAISIVQGVAVLIPAAYLFSRILGPNGIWIAFSLAEIATLVMIFCWYRHMQHKEPGRYADILLLDTNRTSGEKRFEATCSNNDQEAQDIMEQISRFLNDLGLHKTREAAIHASVREMISNVVRHGYPDGRRGFVDIRMLDTKDRITVTLRDGGIGFNPKERMEDPAHARSGLGRVKSGAARVEYSRIIGFNTTTLTFMNGQ